MSGRIYTIVGPSGVGKDTLLAALRLARPDIHIVRRVITRPQAAGGEPFEGVGPDQFDQRVAEGQFALSWEAHGLRYGIPVSVRDTLNTGRDAVFNGSRAVLGQAAAVFPALRVIHITARPEVLADRLKQRGRETPEQIMRRLDRAHLAVPAGMKVFEIDNSGPVEDALAVVLDVLERVEV